MASPERHAMLGPSRGALIVNCPPSIKLTEDMYEEAGAQALEGISAHAQAEYKGRMALGLPHGPRPHSDYDSDVMEEATDEYAALLKDVVDQAHLKCKDPQLLFETEVSMGDFVPDSFGTCDFMCVSEEELTIVDFKYGFQEIDAHGNVQMSMYAIGAYLMFDMLYDFKTVTMIICQPRIHNTSRWTITIEELLTWAETVLKPAAALAAKGEGEFNPGPWCSKYYCKARTRCRARCDELLKLAKMEFKPAPLLSDDELACVLDKADDLSKWAEEIMEYATNEAVNHGKEFPGWKVVTGRSVTKISDEKAVIKDAVAAGVTEEKLYKRSLVSLTELKKLLGKEKYEEVIVPHTIKSTPKLSLARDTDRRREVTGTAVNDFTD